MGEMIHTRRVASILGATETSITTAWKEGQFEHTELGETGAGIPKYYIDEDDPTFVELRTRAENKEPLPDWLEPKKMKTKDKTKGKPGILSHGKGPTEPEIRHGSSKMKQEFGKRKGFKTKIYREKEDGSRSYVTTRPGFIEPEILQELFPEGGGFFLAVHRMLANGEWEYVPNLSRDDEPFSVDPRPGYEDDLDDQGFPGDRERAKDGDFFRGVTKSVFDKRLGSPGDNGATQAIASMQGNITTILSGMINTNNQNFQQMMQASEKHHIQAMEAQTKREEARETERLHEKKMADDAHKADLNRINAEAKARETEREADHKRRMDELDKKHDLDLKTLKTDTEAREKRDKEWSESIQKNQNTLVTKMHEMDVESRDSLKEAVKESLETHTRFFDETHRHLTEEFNLRSSMIPTQIWADALKDFGGKLTQNFPRIMQAIQAPGTVPPGPPGDQTETGGATMGANTLEQIKADPQAGAMLKELMTDMAKFIEQDEPASFYAQKILGMVTTVPGFAGALTDLYMTSMEAILKGVLDSGPERSLLLSEKGKEFWQTLRGFIRNYYLQMQGATPPSPPAS